MLGKLARFLLAAVQGRGHPYAHPYDMRPGKYGKRRKWERSKHDWRAAPYGFHPSHSYRPHRPRGLKGLLLEAVLRRLARRG